MPLDPITVEVVRAALNAAAERMRLTMIKTAYNHIISESLDFGCAIFDANVQMIAQGIGLPVFQGHLGFPIEATIQDRGVEAFREGDLFIHNGIAYKNLLLGVWGLTTDRAGLTGDKSAGGFTLAYPNDLWNPSINYRRVGDAFLTGLGSARSAQKGDGERDQTRPGSGPRRQGAFASRHGGGWCNCGASPADRISTAWPAFWRPC